MPPGNLPPDTELVIASDAVPARQSRASPCRRPRHSHAELLPDARTLGHGRRTVAVAGTHGKSTTTAMLAHLLVAAGCDPTVVYGATPSARPPADGPDEMSSLPFGRGAGGEG